MLRTRGRGCELGKIVRKLFNDPFIFGPARSIGKLLASPGRKTEEVNSPERLSLRFAYCRSLLGRTIPCMRIIFRTRNERLEQPVRRREGETGGLMERRGRDRYMYFSSLRSRMAAGIISASSISDGDGHARRGLYANCRASAVTARRVDNSRVCRAEIRTCRNYDDFSFYSRWFRARCQSRGGNGAAVKPLSRTEDDEEKTRALERRAGRRRPEASIFFEENEKTLRPPSLSRESDRWINVATLSSRALRPFYYS